MNPPKSFSMVIGGKRYAVETSTLLANDAYWDGHNFERHGRNSFLYKTKKGSYFVLSLTCWQGERDTIQPLTLEQARELWESLPEKDVEFEEAFGVPAEEA